MFSVGLSHGLPNVEETLQTASSSNSMLASSKSTVNVILNNVAPPLPTAITEESSAMSGSQQQSIPSNVTVNTSSTGIHKWNLCLRLGVKVSLFFYKSTIILNIITTDIGRIETLQLDQERSTSPAILLWKSIQKYFVRNDGNLDIYPCCVGICCKKCIDVYSALVFWSSWFNWSLMVGYTSYYLVFEL